jgi:S1-C subfamily serine protease
LIGINTAIYAEAQGIGFAIPINRAKRIISDLINYGEVIQPWIGLTVQALDSNMAGYLNLEKNIGALVTAVEPQSPAAKTGIDEGDIILSIDGSKITDSSAYHLKIREISIDQTISIVFIKKGKTIRISLNTIAFPSALALELADRTLGITVLDVDEPTRSKYGIKTRKGVLIVKMRRGFYLERIGVRPGDIIRQIDEEPVDNLVDFKEAMVKYRNKPSLVILILRDGHLYYINATMKDNGR